MVRDVHERQVLEQEDATVTFIVFVELLRFLWATQSRMARFPHNPTSFPPRATG